MGKRCGLLICSALLFLYACQADQPPIPLEACNNLLPIPGDMNPTRQGNTSGKPPCAADASVDSFSVDK